jgi:hypothetical protein
MCIYQALAKCKTEEQKQQVIATYKALVDAADERHQKRGYCKLAKKHAWQKWKKLRDEWWYLCTQCEMTTKYTDLWDERLLEEIAKDG